MVGSIKKNMLVVIFCTFTAPMFMQAALPVGNLFFGDYTVKPFVEGEFALLGTIVSAAATSACSIGAIYKALRWTTYDKSTERDKRNNARNMTFNLLSAATVPAVITRLFYVVWKNTIKWAPIKEVSIMAQRGTLYKG